MKLSENCKFSEICRYFNMDENTTSPIQIFKLWYGTVSDNMTLGQLVRDVNADNKVFNEPTPKTYKFNIFWTGYNESSDSIEEHVQVVEAKDMLEAINEFIKDRLNNGPKSCKIRSIKVDI